MHVTSQQGLLTSPRKGHLPPPQTWEEMTGPQGLGHFFTVNTEPGIERWEAGSEQSIVSKANQQSSKDGNQQD